MRKPVTYWTILCVLLCVLGRVSGAELLTNGDFEVGQPEGGKSASFDCKGDAVYNLPELCAAQAAAMDLIPSSGMAVINDLGNLGNIHPRNKAPVGERLARWALHATYGQTDLVPTGPMIKKVRREDSRLRISFSHVGSGLASRDGKALTWFQVAGADEAYVSATATIDRDTVLVTAPTVPKPEWVRFAWHETAEPNLMNAEGLPANAFAKSCE